jgi:hypothetical protein
MQKSGSKVIQSRFNCNLSEIAAVLHRNGYTHGIIRRILGLRIILALAC